MRRSGGISKNLINEKIEIKSVRFISNKSFFHWKWLVVILSENCCHFVSCSVCNKRYFFSLLEISHMLKGPTAKNQHRYRRLELCTKNQVHLWKTSQQCKLKKKELMHCTTTSCIHGLFLDFSSCPNLSTLANVDMVRNGK